jgi:hypothetical protein
MFKVGCAVRGELAMFMGAGALGLSLCWTSQSKVHAMKEG